jgi:TM2 domain-containing membrane protein YozV
MSGYQPQRYDPAQWQQPPQQQQYQPAPYQPPYPQQYPPPGWQPPMQVAPKSVGLAVLLGLLIPGVGCMYAGKAGLGVAILVAWIVSLILTLVVIGFILAPICWIVSGVLGYTSAQAWNREHGIIS